MTDPDDSSVVASVQDLLDEILSIPTSWVFFIIIAVLVSLVDLNWTPQSYSVRISLTWTTVLLVALLWLPPLLRMLATLGGDITSGDQHAQLQGLLSLLPQAAENLQVLKSKTSLSDEDTQRVNDIIRMIETEIAGEVSGPQEALDRIDELAREYEQIRDEMKPGPSRTNRMETIVAKIRAVADRASFSPQDIRTLFEEGKVGDRIVALSILQRDGSPPLVDVVVEGIKESKSGFEQYHALRAAWNMIGQLTESQRDQLKNAIQCEQSEGEDHYIKENNKDRWELSQKILDELGT